MLNLGILAHVDAGKTTLTERLLYAAGVIGAVGSVDAGTTQTDTLALERQRGITIKSAVVSFEVDGVTVNLIDTPGHPDFIAEVERVLSLLDGAVLVISAVEGVQPQTRILMRALRRLRVPTLLFVNKVDRRGADAGRVLDAVTRRLVAEIIPMGAVDGLGTRAARFRRTASTTPPFVPCSRRCSPIRTIADGRVRRERRHADSSTASRVLAAQTWRSLVHPVFFGSAMTGVGVEELIDGLVDWLPAEAGDAEASAAGRIFKIDRGPADERIAYVRMFAGTLRVRQRLHITTASGGHAEAKATAIGVAEQGTWVRRPELVAGEIGRLWGLGEIRIGDSIGELANRSAGHGGDPSPKPPRCQRWRTREPT